jgi:uncharacterized protein
MDATGFIPRIAASERIREGLRYSPITAVLGPRQCGKTSLVTPFASSRKNLFDLHDLLDWTRLSESNFSVLDSLEGVVIIDEAQEIPELFPKLRVLADRLNSKTRFIITGSASPSIIKEVSESLAGRIHLLPLGGLNGEEVGWTDWQKLWLRGGFPPAFRQPHDQQSLKWRRDYIVEFLWRDLPALVDTTMSREQLRRLFQLITRSHGQFWNHSKMGQIIGVGYKTVQRHIEVFKGAYILRELNPYFVNSEKRIRRAPKLYIRDSGLLHAFSQIEDSITLLSHPIVGFSWEGFGIEQVVSLTNAEEEDCFTWSTPSGPEIDLVLRQQGKLFGFEFKAGDAPRRTKSMIVALEQLGLSKLFVVYPGKLNYPLTENIVAVGIENLPSILNLLREALIEGKKTS